MGGTGKLYSYKNPSGSWVAAHDHMVDSMVYAMSKPQAVEPSTNHMLNFPVPDYIDRAGDFMSVAEDEYIKTEYVRCGYDAQVVAKAVGRDVKEIYRVVD